jgi:hypothetical protein
LSGVKSFGRPHWREFDVLSHDWSGLVSRLIDRFLEMTSGFRPGEPKAIFKASVCEIRRLEKSLRSGRSFEPGETEKVLRRLCQLKGIYFDGYDPPDD